MQFGVNVSWGSELVTGSTAMKPAPPATALDKPSDAPAPFESRVMVTMNTSGEKELVRTSPDAVGGPSCLWTCARGLSFCASVLLSQHRTPVL